MVLKAYFWTFAACELGTCKCVSKSNGIGYDVWICVSRRLAVFPSKNKKGPSFGGVVDPFMAIRRYCFRSIQISSLDTMVRLLYRFIMMHLWRTSIWHDVVYARLCAYSYLSICLRVYSHVCMCVMYRHEVCLMQRYIACSRRQQFNDTQSSCSDSASRPVDTSCFCMPSLCHRLHH